MLGGAGRPSWEAERTGYRAEMKADSDWRGCGGVGAVYIGPGAP